MFTPYMDLNDRKHTTGKKQNTAYLQIRQSLGESFDGVVRKVQRSRRQQVPSTDFTDTRLWYTNRLGASLAQTQVFPYESQEKRPEAEPSA